MQWKNERNGKIHSTLETIFAETDGLEQLSTVFAMMGDSGDVESSKRFETLECCKAHGKTSTSEYRLDGNSIARFIRFRHACALADAATFQRKLASATEDVIADILEQGRSELSHLKQVVCKHRLISIHRRGL